MTALLRVLSPGLLTTIQDLGRVGYQRLGIPVGGALDVLSLRAANALVGNPPDAGALEMAAIGPTFAVEADSVRVAFVGARATLSHSRPSSPRPTDLAAGRSAVLRRGDVLRVGRLLGSATLYMAVEGGFAVEPVLGSVSTYLRGGLGGLDGRALQGGDAIPLAKGEAPERDERVLDSSDLAPPRRLRVLEGPQDDYFSDSERSVFFGRDYVVGPGWSRMGMRLEGTPVRHSRGYDVASDGVVRGSIQIPGDGLPVVLLAEHQTTGGYPKIGAVISADLPALGRLACGAPIAFERVTLEEAEEAARAMAAFVERLPARCRPVAAALDLPARLGELNLVSGVIDARPWVC